MDLPPDLFRCLAGDAPLPLPDVPGERREAGRVFVGRRAAIHHAHVDPRVDVPAVREPVVVRDLSPRSVGLVHTRAMAVGDPFVLTIPAAAAAAEAGKGPVVVAVVECRVVRCVPGSEVGDERSFVVGATFVRLVAAPAGTARDVVA